MACFLQVMECTRLPKEFNYDHVFGCADTQEAMYLRSYAPAFTPLLFPPLLCHFLRVFGGLAILLQLLLRMLLPLLMLLMIAIPAKDFDIFLTAFAPALLQHTRLNLLRRASPRPPLHSLRALSFAVTCHFYCLLQLLLPAPPPTTTAMPVSTIIYISYC